MKCDLQPGRYVLAVSGGVDSVALLDLLADQPGLKLTVAHFDHGIRPDSADDAAFVRQLAQQYGLPFVTERAELGPKVSEASARRARYAFLRQAQAEQGARAIVTAHHQDDVLETAVFNLLRGTGRRGLTSLQSTPQLQRPLLAVSKAEIKAYVLQRKLSWREDTTNHDERYTRNYIRHRLLVRFDDRARQQLLALIARQQTLNVEIDQLLTGLGANAASFNRQQFTALPHDIAKEFLAAWLRASNLADFDRTLLERLTVQAKTRPAGKRLDIFSGRSLKISATEIAL